MLVISPNPPVDGYVIFKGPTEYDCDEYISKEKEFIASGEKYGWD